MQYPRGLYYPRTVQGVTVWACCVSSIGPSCKHREGLPVEPFQAAREAIGLSGEVWRD